MLPKTAALFNSIVLGAEKIISNEPVPTRNPKTGFENVLVIDNLYICAPRLLGWLTIHPHLSERISILEKSGTNIATPEK
jgi:hypothetical protein